MLDYLLPIETSIKPMFGMYAVYAGGRILLMLRDREDRPELNGIWVAVPREYQPGIRTAIPLLSLLPVDEKENDRSDWLLLAASEGTFEDSAVNICELIVRSDRRIGKTPKAKRHKP